MRAHVHNQELMPFVCFPRFAEMARERLKKGIEIAVTVPKESGKRRSTMNISTEEEIEDCFLFLITEGAVCGDDGFGFRCNVFKYRESIKEKFPNETSYFLRYWELPNLAPNFLFCRVVRFGDLYVRCVKGDEVVVESLSGRYRLGTNIDIFFSV